MPISVILEVWWCGGREGGGGGSVLGEMIVIAATIVIIIKEFSQLQREEAICYPYINCLLIVIGCVG